MLLLWPKRQIYQAKREDSTYAKIDKKWYTFRGGADLLFTQRLRKCFTKKLVFKISQNLGFCVKDFIMRPQFRAETPTVTESPQATKIVNLKLPYYRHA